MQRHSTPTQAAQWLRQRVTGQLRTDSRQVQPGDGFVAWPGFTQDGRQFVASALQRGATACLVERAGVEAFHFASDAVAAFPGLKEGAGPIAADYHDQPSRQLSVLAVTGTNGKTSSTWWLAQALALAAPQGPGACGLVGTLGVGLPHFDATGDHALEGLTPTGLTTPDPVLLQATLRGMVERGLRACAIEASSIGVQEHRLDGTHIRLAVLTNLTQDHLDYHHSMQAYWQAKRRLFDWPGLQAAVVNLNDPKGVELADELAQGGLDLWTTGIGVAARLSASQLEYAAQGMGFTVTEGEQQFTLQTRLVGRYNVENLLGVMASLRAMGIDLATAVRCCAQVGAVPGRMESLALPGQPLVVVDYAHTPDALDKALSALHGLAQQRGGQLWCVFGCGGDRDPSKRPMMGAVAEKLAQQVVVTSDNPRTEKPESIVSQILLGLSHQNSVHVQVDRAQAIAQAVAQAQAQDVILVAGKGHEPYQDVAGIKHPFSDRAVAQSALAQRRPA